MQGLSYSVRWYQKIYIAFPFFLNYTPTKEKQYYIINQTLLAKTQSHKSKYGNHKHAFLIFVKEKKKKKHHKTTTKKKLLKLWTYVLYTTLFVIYIYVLIPWHSVPVNSVLVHN